MPCTCNWSLYIHMHTNVKDLGNVFDSVKEEAQSSKKLPTATKMKFLKLPQPKRASKTK